MVYLILYAFIFPIVQTSHPAVVYRAGRWCQSGVGNTGSMAIETGDVAVDQYHDADHDADSQSDAGGFTRSTWQSGR